MDAVTADTKAAAVAAAALAAVSEKIARITAIIGHMDAGNLKDGTIPELTAEKAKVDSLISTATTGLEAVHVAAVAKAAELVKATGTAFAAQAAAKVTYANDKAKADLANSAASTPLAEAGALRLKVT